MERGDTGALVRDERPQSVRLPPRMPVSVEAVPPLKQTRSKAAALVRPSGMLADMSEMWESVAVDWERNADFVEAHLAAATAAMLDAAQIGQGEAVLDLAAGPGGTGIAAAARVGEAGRVVVTDAAPTMVEIAARRTAALPQVQTRLADLTATDALDDEFDVVICRHGLMFVDPPVDSITEAVRVLRPGGRYATMTWDARASNPWLGLILDVVGEQFGVPFPPPDVPGPFTLDDPDRLAAVLTAGGLQDVGVTRIATPMIARSPEDWWGRVSKLAGPLAQALAGMEPEVRQQIQERALASGASASHPAPDGIEFDGGVLVGSGRVSPLPA